MIKGKRGWIREEVPRIILAVLVVSIIIYGAYLLYSSYGNQENQKAKTFIDSLEGKINALEDGESNEFTFRTAKGWTLTSYSKQDAKVPDKCFGKGCICICNIDCSDVKSCNVDSVLSSCQDTGYCRKINVENVKVNNIVLETSLGGEPFIYSYKGFSTELERISINKVIKEINMTFHSEVVSFNRYQDVPSGAGGV